MTSSWALACLGAFPLARACNLALAADNPEIPTMSTFTDYAGTGVYVCNPEPAADGGKTLNDNFRTLADRAVPRAAVLAFAGASAPAGWLPCNGAAVSRTTYAGLFAVVGTTYGAGDGSTTFNMPNLTALVGVGYVIKT